MARCQSHVARIWLLLHYIVWKIVLLGYKRDLDTSELRGNLFMPSYSAFYLHLSYLWYREFEKNFLSGNMSVVSLLMPDAVLV